MPLDEMSDQQGDRIAAGLASMLWPDRRAWDCRLAGSSSELVLRLSPREAAAGYEVRVDAPPGVGPIFTSGNRATADVVLDLCRANEVPSSEIVKLIGAMDAVLSGRDARAPLVPQPATSSSGPQDDSESDIDRSVTHARTDVVAPPPVPDRYRVEQVRPVGDRPDAGRQIPEAPQETPPEPASPWQRSRLTDSKPDTSNRPGVHPAAQKAWDVYEGVEPDARLQLAEAYARGLVSRQLTEPQRADRSGDARLASVIAVVVCVFLVNAAGGDLIGGLLLSAVVVAIIWAIAKRSAATDDALWKDHAAELDKLVKPVAAALAELHAAEVGRVAAQKEAERQRLVTVWSYDQQYQRHADWTPQGPYPDPQALPTWRDTEFLVCRWMSWLGAVEVQTTQATRDGGVDVRADHLDVSVKDHAGSVGSADVQRIAGAAFGRHPVLVGTSRFTAPAVAEADRIGVSLLVLDAGAGTLTGQNAAGTHLRLHGVQARAD